MFVFDFKVRYLPRDALRRAMARRWASRITDMPIQPMQKRYTNTTPTARVASAAIAVPRPKKKMTVANEKTR